MKNKNDVKNAVVKAALGLIISLAVFFFALFGGMPRALGWLLADEKIATVGNPDLSVISSAKIADYTVYRYIIENENTTEGAADTSKQINDIRFQTYDRTFIAQNPFTSVFVRISFLKSAIAERGKITLRVNRNPNPVDAVTEEVLEDDSGAETLSNRCTSVMRFYTGIDKTFAQTAQLYSDKDTALYGAVNNAYYEDMKNGIIGSSFVTKTAEGNGFSYDKADYLIFETTFDENSWNIDPEDGSETLNVYFYITYDFELVNEYITHNLSLGNAGYDDIINDLSDIVVIFTE